MSLFEDANAEEPADPGKVIRAYLSLAIQIGAPSYNYGDQRGCYEVYACTARMLLKAVKGAEAEKKVLRRALERCATQNDPDDQAWTMRHAFDELLGSPTENN
jgi:hypothetical protein